LPPCEEESIGEELPLRLGEVVRVEDVAGGVFGPVWKKKRRGFLQKSQIEKDKIILEKWIYHRAGVRQKPAKVVHQVWVIAKQSPYFLEDIRFVQRFFSTQTNLFRIIKPRLCEKSILKGDEKALTLPWYAWRISKKRL
jgi:hypothetical protein